MIPNNENYDDELDEMEHEQHTFTFIINYYS